MILVVIAALLFLFCGTTGKVVRLSLTVMLCNLVIYFGIPLVALAVLYLKATT